jgi:CDP-diacylglycerol---serine O-phosphatidyltransferase
MFLLERFDHNIKKLKAQTANILTIVNLSLGVLGVLFILKGELHTSLLMIFLAAFFDRFDGMIARKLHIESEFGKQLDSLCDLISFGIAPAFLLYQAVIFNYGHAGIWFTIIYILCGAIRLARFNVTEFTGSFIGLPITVSGCMLTVSYLAINYIPGFIFMFLLLILSFLMISTFQVKKM